MTFTAIETAQSRLATAEKIAEELTGGNQRAGLIITTTGSHTIVDDGQDRWAQSSDDYDTACESYLGIVLAGRFDDVDYTETDWYSDFCGECGCLYSRIGSPSDIDELAKSIDDASEFLDVCEKLGIDGEELPAIVKILVEAGDRFAGNNCFDEAREWIEEDFTVEGVEQWTGVGFWDAKAASACVDAGLDANNAKAAAESLIDKDKGEESDYTDECPIYSVCNGDTDVSVLIAEHDRTEKSDIMACHDKLSGENFDIQGEDIRSEIEQWVRDGIDSDSGIIAYNVDVDNGENYAGEVDPSN